MPLRAFFKSGHWPTLLASFLYFDVSFMVWVLLGPLAVHIACDLHLDASEKGLLVAIPVLSGALLRVVLGLLVDRWGPRRTGLVAQLAVIAALAWVSLGGLPTLSSVYAFGASLGIAGASFAVALPLASRWYPVEQQGLALGIAGAGNSGTVFAALFAPALAEHFGWQHVITLALIPLLIVFVAYALLAKEPPLQPPQRWSQYAKVLRDRDTWWFMFFYGASFGGFVGLASSLVIYFNDQYALSPVIAGFYTAACVFAGSFARPFGGALADRVGGVRALTLCYTVAVAGLFALGLGPASAQAALVWLLPAMAALGMANGAVFQLVPQRFRREIGVITGLVGMAGGIGGFVLAMLLGLAKQWTGSHQPGLFVFIGLVVLAMMGLHGVKRRWRTTWGASSVTTARI